MTHDEETKSVLTSLQTFLISANSLRLDYQQSQDAIDLIYMAEKTIRRLQKQLEKQNNDQTN